MPKKQKVILKALSWTLSIGFVLSIGIIYFPMENPSLDFWGALYFTIRLFILEHDLPSFPTKPPLVFIYFFAPMIFLSAIGTVLTYFLRQSPLLFTRWTSNHVLVCGVGRTGRLIAEALKKARIPVVGIDCGGADCFDEWSSEKRIPMIYGDFHSRAVLEKAGALRARAVIFAAGDDLANLEGAVGAYDWMRGDTGPVRLLWAHIANEKMAQTARIIFQTEGVVGIRYFDTYRIAAKNMVGAYFHRDIRQHIREIAILGFGKFGRDLLEFIVGDFRPDNARTFEIVDSRDLAEEVSAIGQELGLAGKITFTRTNIRNLRLTDRSDKAFFLCTDDDIGNLTTAMTLVRDIRASHIYVRMVKWPISAITEHLGENRGVTFFNINDLVMCGIRELPGIFDPAGDEDLKRRRIRKRA